MTINLDQYTNTLNVTDTATNADLNVTTKGTGAVNLRTNTGTQLKVVDATGTTVDNPWLVRGGQTFVSKSVLTSYAPKIQASDASAITFNTNAGSSGIEGGQQQFAISHTASAVNFVQTTGAATGSGPTISAQGSDTNADLNLTTKGTGSTTIYTPTSVGGTASNSQNIVNFQGVASGNLVLLRASLARHTTSADWTGVGYRFGHVVDVTPMSYIEFNPVGQSQGLAVNVANSSPFQVKTSGGEQFKVANTASAVNWVQVSGAATGGNPYVSAQGSDTNVSLTLSTKGTGGFQFAANGNSVFTGNGGTHFRVRTDLASATGFWEVFGTTGGPIFRSTATTGLIQTSGGQLSLQTDTSGTTQLAVTHTASAVNYVQVTGAATGGIPTISAQGSDSNVNLFLNAKGTGNVFLQIGGANVFQAAGSSTSVNRVLTQANNTGVAPVVQSVGSDTNIPLVLQPKGTGALQAQQTDSAATGGNARGAYSVDFQRDRDAAIKVASGTYSVLAGGQNNTASGNYAFIGGGFGNVASGSATTLISGSGNTATGPYSGGLAGYLNTISGYFSFVGAGASNTTTSSSAVTTQSATMNGTTAVTLSGSNASIRVGQFILGTSISFGTYVAAISGTSLTLSAVASGSSTSTLTFYTPHGVVVGGGNNQATGSYSFIGGGGDAGVSANRNVASGDWSVVCGGHKNTASGVASFVGGGGIAPPFGSFPNTASQTGASVVGGFSNTASNQGTFIGGGYNNTASGVYSAILGGNAGTTRTITGNHVFPACSEPISGALGVSQAALLVLAVQTTDATATVLRSTAAAASTTNQVILPNNSAYFFTGEVVAGVTGGGNTKGWTIEGVIKRGANAASTALVGTPTVTSTYADAGASTWVIAVTADTTNGGLAVTFTGQLATTIRVVCQVRTTEMTF
jgi:hypothetical protein